ncbi:alpha/beta hydrolase family protein [Spirosoma oryzae]|uniref:alpha/beta hydrolase family protein n=1 Tax=Spirosoma oryzae TaxID=1469603 RepID=UPI001472DC79|nr:alpha/beta fold hydrolase [Spirosoma oryzae]
MSSTEVFAYYSKPTNGATGNNPAIVLIHGGGGQAYKEWVQMWASRGYHAIAMDLGGAGADGARLAKAGPEQGDTRKFTSISDTQDKQWIYHAVSNVLAAHALIRSLPGVDSTKTAVVGVSWGGFLATMAAGLDPRIDAASVTYGSAYLQEQGGIFDKYFAQMSAAQKSQWVAKYDPANYLGNAKAQMLWISGATDPYFTPATQRPTHQIVAGQSQYSLRMVMSHSQADGANPNEIRLFLDKIFQGGKGLAQISDLSMSGQTAKATVKGPAAIQKATISYTTDTTLPYSSRSWQTVNAVLSGETITATVPTNATIWFINATDAQGAVVSTPYQIK